MDIFSNPIPRPLPQQASEEEFYGAFRARLMLPIHDYGRFIRGSIQVALDTQRDLFADAIDRGKL